MAERRDYHTIEKVESKFDSLIVQLRKRGDLMLPPERSLCELLGCSRNTARKLLELKVESGVVVKKRFGHTLSLKSAANKKVLGSFSFIADGNSMVGNLAWAKLWARLQPKAEAAGLCAELALIPYDRDDFKPDAFKRSILDVVVVTTLSDYSLELVSSIKRRVMITTEEHYRGLFPNIVALDNYRAGFKAAEALAKRGYKRPAMVCERRIMPGGKPYLQYARRLDGFRDGCRKRKLQFDDSSVLMVEGDGPRLMTAIAKRAMALAKSDFDSVFLYTDVDLAFLMEGLASEGARVPEDLGVITLNSYDNAVRFRPPVSSIAHGTEPMADMLAAKIKTLFEKGEDFFGEILVEPGIHEGRTLK